VPDERCEVIWTFLAPKCVELDQGIQNARRHQNSYSMQLEQGNPILVRRIMIAPNASTRRRGRPTIRSKEVENEICFRIAYGESLRHICLDERMPCRDTVMRWLRRDRLRQEILRQVVLSSNYTS
jgi:hypothetical protein